jgi:hypothetical protein
MINLADVSFWDAVVGKECDKGLGSRNHLVEVLTKDTSLDTEEANMFLDIFVVHGRIVLERGKYRHTRSSLREQ